MPNVVFFFFCLLQSFSALPVAAWKEMAKLLKPIVMKKSRWKPAPKSTLFVRQFRITWVHSLVIAPTKWITVSRGTTVTFSKTAKRQSALSPVVWLSRVIFLCVRSPSRHSLWDATIENNTPLCCCR